MYTEILFAIGEKVFPAINLIQTGSFSFQNKIFFNFFYFNFKILCVFCSNSNGIYSPKEGVFFSSKKFFISLLKDIKQILREKIFSFRNLFCKGKNSPDR